MALAVSDKSLLQIYAWLHYHLSQLTNYNNPATYINVDFVDFPSQLPVGHDAKKSSTYSVTQIIICRLV